MDIEVNMLQGRVGTFHSLPKYAKVDLMSYRRMLHHPDEKRWSLSSPTTYRDGAHLMMWEKGKEPVSMYSGSGGSKQAVQVSVKGGSLTPSIQKAAEEYAAANQVSHWAKKTGCDPARYAAILNDR